MKNKELQVLYNYIVNNVDDKDIKEFISYLQDYVYNGAMVDFDDCETVLKFISNLESEEKQNG